MTVIFQPLTSASDTLKSCIFDALHISSVVLNVRLNSIVEQAALHITNKASLMNQTLVEHDMWSVYQTCDFVQGNTVSRCVLFEMCVQSCSAAKNPTCYPWIDSNVIN